MEKTSIAKTFFWNGYNARTVTKEDTWCHFKSHFRNDKPAMNDAPYGYVVEIPEEDWNDTKLQFWGSIKRSKVIRCKKILLLQIVLWPEQFFDRYKVWNIPTYHITKKEDPKTPIPQLHIEHFSKKRHR